MGPGLWYTKNNTRQSRRMTAMEENRALLQRWIDESSRIVFFGGAGVSTESGIPDFRSVDGLYNQQYARDHSQPHLL